MEQSTLDEYMVYRNPTTEEYLFFCRLVSLAEGYDLPYGIEGVLEVAPMSDGGMGSLRLRYNEVSEESGRFLGKQISEYMFKDDDGVDVIATLYVDQNGKFFEIDMWKTNFGTLVSYPNLK